MIINMEKFLDAERGHWTRLEEILGRIEDEPNWRMSLAELKDFHYLYQRASADLGKLATFASEPETRRYVESLVARAYGEIHESREKKNRLDLLHWFFHLFPQTFRRHIRAFWLSLTPSRSRGVCLGGAAIALDPDAKPVLMPFPTSCSATPSERVAEE